MLLNCEFKEGGKEELRHDFSFEIRSQTNDRTQCNNLAPWHVTFMLQKFTKTVQTSHTTSSQNARAWMSDVILWGLWWLQAKATWSFSPAVSWLLIASVLRPCVSAGSHLPASTSGGALSRGRSLELHTTGCLLAAPSRHRNGRNYC